MTVATTASAGDNTVILANVEKNLPRQGITITLPPLVTERYEFYDINGSTEKDLKQEMRRKGVTGDDGKKYEAITRWLVRWNYDHTRGTESCSADSFQLIIEIVFRYPRWTRMEDAPHALMDKWEGYMKHLTAHENGHRDMVLQAAAGLSRAVSDMPPAQTCAQLDREVRILSRTRMNKLNDDERQYDEATNHGATQGAIFP
jgi:predicted secreted Zn-dependent protease